MKKTFIIVLLLLSFFNSCCNCANNDQKDLVLVQDRIQEFYKLGKEWPESFTDFSENTLIKQVPFTLQNEWGTWQRPHFKVNKNKQLQLTAESYTSSDGSVKMKNLTLTIDTI